jgi:hypothetical protein
MIHKPMKVDGKIHWAQRALQRMKTLADTLAARETV